MKRIRPNQQVLTSDVEAGVKGASLCGRDDLRVALRCKNLLIAWLVAVATISCEDTVSEWDNGDDTGIETTSIVVSAPLATSNLGFQWDSTSKIGVTNSMSTSTFVINSESTFDGTLLSTVDEEIITAVYPYTTTMTYVDSDGDGLKDALESSYSLSNTQSHYNDSDKSLARLFPYLYGATSAKSYSNGLIEIPMEYGVAIVEIKINNIPDDTTLSSIAVTCEGGLSSDIVTTQYNLESGQTTLTPSSDLFNEIVVTLADATSVSESTSVYMVVSPQTVAQGTVWNFSVMHAISGGTTKLGNSVNITFDSSVELLAGNSTPVEVTLDIEETFEHSVTLSSSLSLESALADIDVTMMDKLVINGEMTEADITYTRNLPAVKILDMSNATIDAMPTYLYSDDGGIYYPVADVLEQVMLPKGLTTLAGYCFERCSSLMSVTIPEGYQVIGASAFESCEKLTSVTLPSTITTIYNWAFESTALTSVELPASLDYLGNGAYYKCYSLTYVKFLGNIPSTLNSGAFTYSADDRVIYVPESQVSAFQAILTSYVDQIVGY